MLKPSPVAEEAAAPHAAPPEPARPAPFEADRPALREVYARQLRRSDREALEQIADSILELSREAEIDEGLGGYEADLAALALDLRRTSASLAHYGASEGNILERWESRLADVAERVAPRVAELAAEIEAAVAAASEG